MGPRRFLTFLLPLAGLLVACSTPYRPPVVVHGSASFPGIATTIATAGGRPVDVLLVHGMCTHDDAWATRQIDNIAGIVADHAPQPLAGAAGAIHVIDSIRSLAGGTVRFHEGVAHDMLRAAMVETIARIVADNPNGAGTLVVVAESLGSKMLFDALSIMLESRDPRRLALLFMAGNQLPMLALAEQAPGLTLAPPQDALQRFLALRRTQAAPRVEQIRQLAIVALTDPNDLLSYQLLPARYAAPDVAVADVLVSNDRTWLGLLENPVTAHLDYLSNPAVGKLIACGFPQAEGCW